jgi:pimeloyl-ACP methyl ester carboxylesterase
MIVAFLPGFCQPVAQLAFWKDILQADVRLFDLPNHYTGPPLGAPSLADMADHYMSRISPDTIVVGESLGGLIALKMAASGYRAVAIDPPLSTAKLWVLHEVLAQLLVRQAAIPWMAPFVDAYFGVRVGHPPQTRNYWPLLDEATSPVHIIAATEPLWPMRRINPTPSNTPSVLDEIDAYHLARHPNARFRSVQGPHTLLTEAVDAVKPALIEALAELDGRARV